MEFEQELNSLKTTHLKYCEVSRIRQPPPFGYIRVSTPGSQRQHSIHLAANA